VLLAKADSNNQPEKDDPNLAPRVALSMMSRKVQVGILEIE